MIYRSISIVLIIGINLGLQCRNKRIEIDNGLSLAGNLHKMACNTDNYLITSNLAPLNDSLLLYCLYDPEQDSSHLVSHSLTTNTIDKIYSIGQRYQQYVNIVNQSTVTCTYVHSSDSTILTIINLKNKINNSYHFAPKRSLGLQSAALVAKIDLNEQDSSVTIVQLATDSVFVTLYSNKSQLPKNFCAYYVKQPRDLYIDTYNNFKISIAAWHSNSKLKISEYNIKHDGSLSYLNSYYVTIPRGNTHMGTSELYYSRNHAISDSTRFYLNVNNDLVKLENGSQPGLFSAAGRSKNMIYIISSKSCLDSASFEFNTKLAYPENVYCNTKSIYRLRNIR